MGSFESEHGQFNGGRGSLKTVLVTSPCGATYKENVFIDIMVSTFYSGIWFGRQSVGIILVIKGSKIVLSGHFILYRQKEQRRGNQIVELTDLSFYVYVVWFSILTLAVCYVCSV